MGVSTIIVERGLLRMLRAELLSGRRWDWNYRQCFEEIGRKIPDVSRIEWRLGHCCGYSGIVLLMRSVDTLCSSA